MANTSILNPRSPVLQKALEKGETVRWCSQPRMRWFGIADLIIIPFMSVWCYGVFTMLGRSWSEFLHKPSAADTFGLFLLSMFGLVGIYMLFGRVIHNFWQYKNRYYMITNKRVISYSSFWPPSIDSKPLSEVEDVWVWSDRKGGSGGSIAFGTLSLREWHTISFGAAAIGTRQSLMFSDLDDIKTPLAEIKSACSGRELKVEDVRKLLTQEIPMLLKGQGSDGNGRKPTIDIKVQDGARSNAKETKLSSDSDKARLVQLHKRNYIWRSIGLLFGAAASFAFAATQLGYYDRDFKSATQSKDWPCARGKISDLQVITTKGAPYLDRFAIDFVVDGKLYKCTTYSLQMGSEEQRKNQLRFATEHKIGDPADVFYDPKDPDVSLIDRSADLPAIVGRKDSGIGAQVIGLLFLLAAVYRLMFGARQTFKPKPLQDNGLGTVLYGSAFMSVWIAMVVGSLLAPFLGRLFR
jgi:hypothetical protein